MTDISSCVACGGTVAPDGRCWDCGAPQPAFRSHLEITTGSGAAGVSDRGLRRGVNADAMASATTGSWTIGVVCDGVSMSPRADRAAQVAAEVGAATLVTRLGAGALPEVALAEATVRAGRAVAALATSVHDAPACTYVAGVVGPAGLWAGGVGDSRAYWLPDTGTGMALTEDDAGEHEMLSAWLGADADEVTPRVRSFRPPGAGRLLLCTDGLSRYLPDAESLRAVLRRHTRSAAPGDAQVAAARALVGHALAAGGQDNVTALLIPTPTAFARQAGPSSS
ncbi:PP2C family protein-serine/threonine phosphatase [Nonomuraea glycinis]|uniref:PP2C family protein-serine/threonine phosphatase n=1 Tax=Nonomuraea glycinis TaxID=2047744 RepID=UPI00339F1D69